MMCLRDSLNERGGTKEGGKLRTHCRFNMLGVIIEIEAVSAAPRGPNSDLITQLSARLKVDAGALQQIYLNVDSM